MCALVKGIIKLCIADEKLRPLIFTHEIISKRRMSDGEINPARQIFIKKEMHGIRVEILVICIPAKGADIHFIAVVHLESGKAKHIVT